MFPSRRSGRLEVMATDELQLFDEEIAALRQQLEQLRDDLTDFDDSPAATRIQEELEAQIAVLESRRHTLLDANSMH
jgi:chromosome segregation ATPase